MASCPGVCHADAISRGLQWLEDSPEIDGSLFDKKADLDPSKVARREPGKLVRGLQATASKASIAACAGCEHDLPDVHRL
ncbi:MAG: hypothetical protein R3E58_06365 [Phycisphaerae bacterium]